MQISLQLTAALLLFAAAHSVFPEAPVSELKGRSISQLAAPGERVVVLIFAATDCPISNRYIPEIERLNREWQSKGVRVWWIFPNPGDTAGIVKQHQRQYSITTPTLIDANQELVRMAHATVTPEAAVFAVDRGELRETYRGRIDNRYLAFGQERPQATRHDLDTAIRAALDGSAPPKPDAGPVGCSIVPAHLKP